MYCADAIPWWMLQLWFNTASPCSELKGTSSVNCRRGTLCSSSRANTALTVMLTFQPPCTCPFEGPWFPLVHLGPIPGSEWSLTCHLTCSFCITSNLANIPHVLSERSSSSEPPALSPVSAILIYKFRLLHIGAVMLPSVLACVECTV